MVVFSERYCSTLQYIIESLSLQSIYTAFNKVVDYLPFINTHHKTLDLLGHPNRPWDADPSDAETFGWTVLMLFAPRRKVMIQVGSWFARMDTVSCNQRLHGDNTKRFMIEGIIHPGKNMFCGSTPRCQGRTAKPLDDGAVQLESLFLSLWQAHGVYNWNIWVSLFKLVLFDVQSSLRRFELETRWHEGKLHSCPSKVRTGSFYLHLRWPKCSSYRCQNVSSGFFERPAGARNVAATGAWSCALEKYWQWFSHPFCQGYLDRHLWTQRVLEVLLTSH